MKIVPFLLFTDALAQFRAVNQPVSKSPSSDFNRQPLINLNGLSKPNPVNYKNTYQGKKVLYVIQELDN